LPLAASRLARRRKRQVVGAKMQLPICVKSRSVFLAAMVLFAFTLPRSTAEEPAKKTGSIDVEEETVHPGIVGSYRSLSDAQAVFARIDAKPAFYLGRSSPDPRIPPGPFEVVWRVQVPCRSMRSFAES
jgi:hypothetical protein